MNGPVNGTGVLVVAAVLGFVGGWTCWRMLAPAFEKPIFARTNVHGATVPVAVGIVLPVVLVVAAACLVVANSFDLFEVRLDALAITVAGATGFALVGFLDDLVGDGEARGFVGHLRALRSGVLTTGSVKLFGGAAVAVVIASATSPEAPLRLLADAGLIALSANLANLFDRAPGRVAKAALAATIPIAVAAGADPRLTGPVIVVGAVAALVFDDLRQRLMLGDTGANVIGGTLGLAVVLTSAPTTRTATLIVVLALNLVSERFSFSSIIDRTPPLRWFDRLGR